MGASAAAKKRKKSFELLLRHIGEKKVEEAKDISYAFLAPLHYNKSILLLHPTLSSAEQHEVART